MTAQQIDLAVAVRQPAKKSELKAMRDQGKVPAIYYGHGVENRQITVEEKALIKLLSTESGMNVIVNLKMGEETHPAIVRVLDQDPINGRVEHVDFQHINLNEKITTHVPIKLKGLSPAVKLGGILEHHMHAVNIRCLPLEMPGHFEVDISTLTQVGHGLHVKDIELLKQYEVMDDPDGMVVMVSAPRVEEVTETTEEEAKEPEVVEKGKKESSSEEAKEDKSSEKK